MGFSKEIKEDILVNSARHCCVCRRYRGVKIEIHHIISKEQDGEDSYDNAIPLCFDCHSDAGHYFAKHPNGTKFSPNELKKHKANWFKIVAENSIPLKKENSFHARYLITKEFDLIKDISNRNLERFPIKNCILLDNQVLEQCRNILKKQTYRHLEIENNIEIGPEEYSKKYPNAILSTKESEYKHFYHERTPSNEDIKNKCKTDSVSQYLVDNGVLPQKIARILTCYEGECAGRGAFQELFVLRPLYFKYLVLTNISNDYAKLQSLIAIENDKILYGQGDFAKEEKIEFPNVLIEPNQSVIVPIGMFLANFDDLEKSDDYIRIHEIDGDRSQVLDHTSIDNHEGLEYFRKNYLPKILTFDVNGHQLTQDIHDFDFKNIYWIDGYWNCGSCPHLFFEKINSELLYQGEIFNEHPDKISAHRLIIEKDIIKLIIAELENETITISWLKINGETKIINKKLTIGQSLNISVSENDKIEMEGYYSIESNSMLKLPIYEKYIIVKKFKTNYA